MALPLSNLLQKDVEFDFDDRCKEAFDCLKRAVTTTPIIQGNYRPLTWKRKSRLSIKGREP